MIIKKDFIYLSNRVDYLPRFNYPEPAIVLKDGEWHVIIPIEVLAIAYNVLKVDYESNSDESFDSYLRKLVFRN